MQTKLFRRDFALVVIGQIISLFGNAILRFALPLYLLRETGSSTLFGVVTACSFAPMVILSMVGGGVICFVISAIYSYSVKRLSISAKDARETEGDPEEPSTE